MKSAQIRCFLALLLWCGGACQSGAEPELAPRPDVIFAYWNPGAGVLPSPTDLVFDKEEGRLNIPIRDGVSGAEREFTAYLNSLDGYPLSTTIRFPVSGPIKDSSLLGAVFLLEDGGGERLLTRSFYDEELQAVVVEPLDRLKPGQRYVAALVGYEKGAKGRQGQAVISDAPFYFLKSPESLEDHVDAFPGATRAEREEQARAMAALQEGLKPAMQALKQRGIEAEDIAVITQFTTSAQPAVQFDTVAGLIPMPNDLLFNEETQTLDLPIPDGVSDEERALREALASYDGFSLSGAMTVQSTHRLGQEPPGPAVMRLFRRVGGLGGQAWQEVEDLERGLLKDGQTLWMEPELALEPGQQYVFLVMTELRDMGGRSHRAQPVGAMLRLSHPLIEDGRSQLSLLNMEQAEQLEPRRLVVDELLTQLEEQEGLDRREIAAAVPFRTLRSMEPLLAWRAKLYEQEVSTKITNVEHTEPGGLISLLIHDVETVIRGEMTILDRLDPRTRAFYSGGHAEERSVKFVLTLPKEADVTRPIPVVLFGHGLATSRELLYLIAGPLAKAGYAGFAMDLPYHGARAVCRDDGSCAGEGTCDDEGTCRNKDGSPGRLNEVNVGYLVPLLAGTQYDQLLNYPISSGEVFIDIEDIVATRDHFAQALLDLQQAVRLLQSDEFNQAIIDETGLWLEQEDIMYLGMSLGGILGAALSALEPHLKDFVLNVPAAHLTKIIENSASFTTAFQNALDERDIEPGSDGYFHFINGLRWLLDPVDPLNLVQHTLYQPYLYLDPIEGAPYPERQVRVMLQMAQGDSVVPNIGTEYLSARLGEPITVYTPSLTDHAFLFDPNPMANNSRRAREDLVSFFDERERP